MHDLVNKCLSQNGNLSYFAVAPLRKGKKLAVQDHEKDHLMYIHGLKEPSNYDSVRIELFPVENR